MVQTLPINWSPFSTKAMQSIKYSDKFINILEGAVRSSKTVSSVITWIAFLEESPHRYFLMTGKTENSVYRNVLDGDTGVLSIMGEGRAKYKRSGQGGALLEVYFPNKDPETKKKTPMITKYCYVVGANDALSESKIRGMTIGGWYADEVTIYPETFVKQAINRMSLAGARAFWTCNPDSPYHYIYTEYIKKAKEKGYAHFHFSLDDNLSLGEEYKDNLKAAYAGLFYERFVNGRWVLSDGLIYDMFDKSALVVPTVKRDYSVKYVSIDYGTQNPTTFGMFGKELQTNQWFKIKEYHHSGREGEGQKTDTEYADDLQIFLDGEDLTCIVDPAAASFIAELRKRGITVIKARNSVIEGIRHTSTALKNKEILFNDCCEETFSEFGTYIWDEKASLKGDDKPVKENDHHMDNLRYFVNTILRSKKQDPIKDELYNRGKGVIKAAPPKYARKGRGIF